MLPRSNIQSFYLYTHYGADVGVGVGVVVVQGQLVLVVQEHVETQLAHLSQLSHILHLLHTVVLSPKIPPLPPRTLIINIVLSVSALNTSTTSSKFIPTFTANSFFVISFLFISFIFKLWQAISPVYRFMD